MVEGSSVGIVRGSEKRASVDTANQPSNCASLSAIIFTSVVCVLSSFCVNAQISGNYTVLSF